jgi:hypothetical protein
LYQASIELLAAVRTLPDAEQEKIKDAMLKAIEAINAMRLAMRVVAGVKEIANADA